ncbi:FMN-linked oxidoreductase [Myriangium duriaei CBS 260.36]|uniref:Dihydroorotate dehydrogenase (quinone), mitochondrial n=1 Tax=Myriangium duriaei CBS 260.36 TaxID=1168546 RepID=A0A9P4JB30_9PEZI|nr:FMN-linked oxidoreductase [Myriangium duriaei CBS 260.36]
MGSLHRLPLMRQPVSLLTRLPSVTSRTVFSRQLHLHQRPRIPQLSTTLIGKPQRRLVSNETAADARSTVTRLKNFFFGTSIVLALSFTYLYVTDTRASIHEWLVVPVLRTVVSDAEDAHKVGNKALAGLYTFGLHPRERGDVDAKGDLRVEVFGHILDNPIGTSAGLDKNADIPSPLLALGPGIVEVGGATPFPQEGNDKPRVWRIPSQNALINRYGLNSEGADSVALRLKQRVREFAHSIGLGLGAEAERKVLDGEAGVPPGSLVPGRLLAVQCAKMKTTPDGDIGAVAQDYVYCVTQLGKYADIIVVNVSSPNTPGLRSLQAATPLTAILTSVVGAAQACDRKTKPAVMVKVSPDEDSEDQVRDICAAVWTSGVDGIIVGNTTKKRPDHLPRGFALTAQEEKIMLEQGGYSGPQLFERTVSLVKKYRSILDQGPPQPKPDEKPEVPTSATQKEKPEVPSVASGSERSGDNDLTSHRIDQSIQRDAARLKPLTEEADAESKQPLLKLPERHAISSEPSHELQAAEPGLSASNHAHQVIFATGGITNGKQALEVLNAGASVAMVYTALVYGGAGTISRIKSEMRDEISKKGSSNP